jgi:preprotein translocase subunit SecA
MLDRPQIADDAARARPLAAFVERERDRLPVDHPANWMRVATSLAGRAWRARRVKALALAAAAQERAFADMGEAPFAALRNELAMRLRRGPLGDELIVQSLAFVREASRRTLGLLPYVEQMTAGAALVFGHAVEMATGEGKTLTAAFPAAIHALGGRAVHVVTSNDYLTGRDHDELAALYRFLGLTTGLVLHEKSPDERRVAYEADITYVSNKEVAFDYLRDRIVARTDIGDPSLSRKLEWLTAGENRQARPVQRGLDVAIVDEVDSVLIDEAGTPLLISAPADGAIGDDVAKEAMAIARSLQDRQDYLRAPHGIGLDLTEAGIGRIETAAEALGGPWRQRVRRDSLVNAALVALHGLERDRHYIVRDGKVVIVDEHSGRTMPDRFWERDIHAMVEFKEGCALSDAKRSLASISFQRFFRRYRTLSGMSGTIREVAGELARVYRLPLTPVARRRPRRLADRGCRIFPTRDELWAAVAAEVAQLQTAGTPVLIGVCTVADAERASAQLAGLGIAHRVLSAAQDRDEALAIAKAGQRGAVTVATSMAGRGTDIRLGDGVAEAGGLFVMVCERHGSRRVDRQLIGRCARQGDPGAFAEFLSAEDAVLVAGGPLARKIARLPNPKAVWAFWLAQKRTERAAARQRLNLVRRDERLEQTLAFAGGLD